MLSRIAGNYNLKNTSDKTVILSLQGVTIAREHIQTDKTNEQLNNFKYPGCDRGWLGRETRKFSTFLCGCIKGKKEKKTSQKIIKNFIR
jgi:hypothetical protein